MYPTYNKLKVHILPITYENWLTVLKKTFQERPGFLVEDATIEIGQVLGEFLGMPLDLDEYYNQLYDYVNSKEIKLHLLSEDTLDKTINNQHFQSIQKVINLNNEQNLSINRFTAFLDGEQLLLKHPNPILHRKIREAMISVLELFVTKEANGLKSSDLRRVLVDLVKWNINHLAPVFNNADPQFEMPRFLWYGNFKKSHQYFIQFLVKLGCDVIAFNPEGVGILSETIEDQVFVYHYQNKLLPEPFPTEKRNRKTTVAYRASKEIETILNQEGTGLYKPWQLREYTPFSITLKTTYDELFILCKEPAMIRPDFEVRNGLVGIPALFAKIQGVSRNKKEYWDRLLNLTDLENSLLIRQFPFTTTISNDFRFHYRNALGRDGLLSSEKMMSSHYWPYTHLPVGLQKGISDAIRRICDDPKFKAQHTETKEELKVFLFSQSMQMPKNIIQLLERFDYSQQVPKLILYNSELNGIMTRSDAALLFLLNNFGIDIIIYNPTGHNDIENFIDQELYDTHWLEEVIFDQEFKETFKFKKGFFHGIIKNFKGD